MTYHEKFHYGNYQSSVSKKNYSIIIGHNNTETG